MVPSIFANVLGNNQKSKKLTKEDRQKKIDDKRRAKKQRIKEMFNSEYDKVTSGDGAENRFDSRKAELDIQAKVNHYVRACSISWMCTNLLLKYIIH